MITHKLFVSCRYNRISNGDYCKCMCLYSNECEIPELSNILDFTVVFTPPPFSPEIVPAVFHVCPFSCILFGLRATPKTKAVKSFIFHGIARLRTARTCIRHRLSRRGANTHCKGLHCWIQRMMARISLLLACVRRRRGVRCLTTQLTIHSNKGMIWEPGLAARTSQHER